MPDQARFYRLPNGSTTDLRSANLNDLMVVALDVGVRVCVKQDAGSFRGFDEAVLATPLVPASFLAAIEASPLSSPRRAASLAWLSALILGQRLEDFLEVSRIEAEDEQREDDDQ